MDKQICRICNEVIEFPKDKNQTAHEICVYAEDMAKSLGNLNKRAHKENILVVMRKLSGALVGLQDNNKSTIEYQDAIIAMHEKLIALFQQEFGVYLGEEKEDIIAKKMEDQMPFFRLDMIAKSLGFSSVHTFLGVAQPTVSSAKTSSHMPNKWDDYLLEKGVNPCFVRSGRGDMFTSKAV